MPELERIVEEYEKLRKRVEELRRELYGVIIKYLIQNSAFPDKCTELAISNNLKLKRSTVRKILQELEEARVIEYEEIGRMKVYKVSSICWALDTGYVSFTKEEIHRIFGIKKSKEREIEIGRFGQGVTKEGVIKYRGRGESWGLEGLASRFFNYLNVYLLGKDAILKIMEVIPNGYWYIPESWSLNKLHEAASPVPHLKLIPDPKILLDREKVKEVLREEVSQKIKSIVTLLEEFALILEKIGYQKFVEWSATCPIYAHKTTIKGIEADTSFKKEYLWGVTLMLREACKFARVVGVKEDLIKRALNLADMLDLAVEEEYRGKEVEGLSLEEWYKSRRQH